MQIFVSSNAIYDWTSTLYSEFFSAMAFTELRSTHLCHWGVVVLDFKCLVMRNSVTLSFTCTWLDYFNTLGTWITKCWSTMVNLQHCDLTGWVAEVLRSGTASVTHHLVPLLWQSLKRLACILFHENLQTREEVISWIFKESEHAWLTVESE